MRLLVFIFCVSFSPLVSALSLDEAISLAKEHSEDLKIRMAEIQKREAQKREALGRALPQISAEATWQKYFKDPVFFGSTVPINYQLQSGVNVSQTIWAFGKVSGALKAAKAGLKIGELEKELTENQVEYMATVAYFSALLSETQLRIARQTLDNAKENLAILQRKFSGGRPPQGDLIRLRSDVAARIPQVSTAEAEHRQALLTLAQMIERDVKDIKLTTSFGSEFSLLNEQELLKRLEDNQPRLELLKQTVVYNSEVARVQNALDWPTLSVFGSYTYSGASEHSITSNDLFDSFYGGLALTWNLWDGGQSSAKYRQAISDKMIAELSLEQGRETLTLDLKKSLENYKALVESHKSAREAVNLAEQSFKISQRRFRTGQASVTELNQTEAALTQARLALSLNLYQIHATKAQINNLIAEKSGARP